MDRPPYRVAARLVTWAARQWHDLDGYLLLEGIDLWTLPPDRACNVLHHLLFRHADEQQRSRLEFELTRPMTGQEVDADDPYWGDDAEASTFMSSMRRTGGTGA